MDDRLLVVQMIAYMEQNLTLNIDAEALALKSGYSLNRLRQKFFNVTQQTPSSYIRKRRLTEASKEILAGKQIADLALKYGYSSQDNFTTAFRSYFGIAPKELYLMEKKYKKYISKLEEVFSIMELANLSQPPLCTTLMGCIKGASDYFDRDLSTPLLFGLTGHGFLMNIHKELCTSGPYNWKYEHFFKLLENIGISMAESISLVNDGIDKRSLEKAEGKIKGYLNEGNLCVLNFLENQLVSGYDENGFVFLKPWNCKTSTEIPYLSFGSWEECFSKMKFVRFIILSNTSTQKNILESIKDALNFALVIYQNPEQIQKPNCAVGHGAYDTWIAGIKNNLGKSHGHWWNGSVWTECRLYVSKFFGEISELLDNSKGEKLCADLQAIYEDVSSNIGKAKEKDLAAEEQIKLLSKSAKMEKNAETLIEELVASM